MNHTLAAFMGFGIGLGIGLGVSVYIGLLIADKFLDLVNKIKRKI